VTLTEKQAYDAMFLFLAEYWERGNRSSRGIADLLSNLERGVLWEDDKPTDPAMDEDWDRCVRRVLDGFDPYKDFGKPS
jgi:hypothetical protein